jgi:hypothetical protein
VANNEGKSIIKIDALENIPNNFEIYLHDNVTGIYHDIKNNDYPYFSLMVSITIDSHCTVNKLYNVGKTV